MELSEQGVRTLAKGTMEIIGQNVRLVTWDLADPATVEEAKQAFASATGNGMMAYTDNKGKELQHTKTFDPNAEKIVLMPPLAGG